LTVITDEPEERRYTEASQNNLSMQVDAAESNWHELQSSYYHGRHSHRPPQLSFPVICNLFLQTDADLRLRLRAFRLLDLCLAPYTIFLQPFHAHSL
jgi:hypothetical protein